MERRYYLVDCMKLHKSRRRFSRLGYAELTAPFFKLSDKKFMEIAEGQGTVYSEQEFVDLYNSLVPNFHSLLRIIEVKTE